MRRFGAGHVTALVLGLGFLYLPILVLVVYSFNASRLVTVWGGFSTRWYAVLLANQTLLEAAWLSLKVAFVSASLATFLGTLAALALVRQGRFFGRTMFSGLLAAPIVMPEVVTGLALLLFFVALSVERGFVTLTIAHVTLSMCYATIVIQTRLIGFDRALEEAAQDLGAAPLTVFRTITLPLIAPGLAAAWLLAFTLSLDDLVIASMTTGPGATTLPMRIYSAIRLGVTPEINAASTILIAFVTITVIIASLMVKRQAR